ncbi:hypothetical protein F2Q70_00025946 [Brassica cretica]|uniref:Uncharacterized protein n=1 Tax=Brassica cretica TaxID=69181 RepID=A0A8S9LHQ5_BRACR|nr:hypothetical protein F2Q70_00025946 [Brassica cretica]
MSTSTLSAFSQVMSIDDVVLLSIDFWSTLSIAVAWRVSIDTSLVDLRIVRESVGSFFEELINHLFIVVLMSIDAINELSIDTPFRPSIDTTTKLSIDDPSRKLTMFTRLWLKVGKIHGLSLDEITFAKDFLKEDIYQELKDISESTNARLGMQQRNIGNLQHRMNASEVARERLKNKWTRGDEVIRSFIEMIDMHFNVSIDIDISDQTSNLIELNLLVLGLGIHWIEIFLQIWKISSLSRVLKSFSIFLFPSTDEVLSQQCLVLHHMSSPYHSLVLCICLSSFTSGLGLASNSLHFKVFIP